MKKVLVLIMVMVSGLGFSQKQNISVNKDSIYVKKIIDEMANKTYLLPSRMMILANENRTIGIKLDCLINDDFTTDNLIITTVGVGTCSENDEMIILFENGEKITKTAWNKFNCKGLSYIKLNSSDIKILRTQKLSKIRMTNGRTFESFTGTVEKDDKRYFMQLFYALDNKFVTIKYK